MSALLLQRPDGSRLTQPAHIGTCYSHHAVFELQSVARAELRSDQLPSEEACFIGRDKMEQLACGGYRDLQKLGRIADRLVSADLGIVVEEWESIEDVALPTGLRDVLQEVGGRTDSFVRMAVQSYCKRSVLLASKPGKAAIRTLSEQLCAEVRGGAASRVATLLRSQAQVQSQVLDRIGPEETLPMYDFAFLETGDSCAKTKFSLVLLLGSRKVERAVREKSRSRGLTACKPALALLMGNMAGLERDSCLILDPFAGSAGLLTEISTFFAATALGSDISAAAFKSRTSRVSLLLADVACSPFRRIKADAVLFDPPFGLREGGNVHGIGASRCYIGDWSGEELLARVATAITDALVLAAGVLDQGGRAVYLMPVFPSQEKMGLWRGNDGFENLANTLPTHKAFRLKSCVLSPCRKKESIARRIVVMERI